MLMAESHRVLTQERSVARAEAFACQALKRIEQAGLDHGESFLRWSFAGMTELNLAGRMRRGAAHPVELSAGMSFLKELRSVEEWRAWGKKGTEGGPVAGGTALQGQCAGGRMAKALARLRHSFVWGPPCRSSSLGDCFRFCNAEDEWRRCGVLG